MTERHAEKPPVDDINLSTAAKLLGRKPGDSPPMAMCPKCGAPLVSTLEFRGAEFICVPCDQTYGFLSPKPAKWTQEIQDRHDELQAEYEAARAKRREA